MAFFSFYPFSTSPSQKLGIPTPYNATFRIGHKYCYQLKKFRFDHSLKLVLRAIFCKSHPTCDSRVFRISSYFNQLKIKVILKYGRNFNFIRHFVEFLGGRETTAVFEKMQSVSTSYILNPPSASENCFSKFKLLLHETF